MYKAMYKAMYTNEELTKQLNFNEHKCERCLHKCKEFGCKTQNFTANMAERTPDITPELKKRYFALVGA